MKLFHGSPKAIIGVFRVSARGVAVEIGPGLYVTTLYERAYNYSYSKEGYERFMYSIDVEEEDLKSILPDFSSVEAFIQRFISRWGMSEGGLSYDDACNYVFNEVERAGNTRSKLPELYLSLWSNLTFKNQSQSEEFMVAFSSFFGIDFIQHPERDDEYVLLNRSY